MKTLKPFTSLLIAGTLGTLALLLPAKTAWAHHNMTAVFDLNDRSTITGTLAKIDWRNPHIELIVTVKRDGGAVETWRTEGPNPAFFQVRYVTKADFEKVLGETMTIEVSRARDGSTWGLLRNITMPGGKVLSLCPENC